MGQPNREGNPAPKPPEPSSRLPPESAPTSQDVHLAEHRERSLTVSATRPAPRPPSRPEPPPRRPAPSEPRRSDQTGKETHD